MKLTSNTTRQNTTPKPPIPEKDEADTLTLPCGHTYWIGALTIKKYVEQNIEPVCAFDECSEFFGSGEVDG